MPIPTALRTALDHACSCRTLIVISDFDGTLAPFVDDPNEARAIEGALECLTALGELSHTEAALVSGRGRSNLAVVSGAPHNVTLIGSHGAEWDENFASSLPPQAVATLGLVRAQLRDIIASQPLGNQAHIEEKEFSAVLHLRTVTEGSVASKLQQLALAGPGALPGTFVTLGKNVVEIAVAESSKGTAIKRLALRNTPDGNGVAIVFFGDDVTDEKGFSVLPLLAPALCVGVKVGDGETSAQFRVDQITDVRECLTYLRDTRDSQHTLIENGSQ